MRLKVNKHWIVNSNLHVQLCFINHKSQVHQSINVLHKAPTCNKLHSTKIYMYVTYRYQSHSPLLASDTSLDMPQIAWHQNQMEDPCKLNHIIKILHVYQEAHNNL